MSTLRGKPPLAVGQRVWKIGSGTGAKARFGRVMPHEPEYLHPALRTGSFPVRFDDQVWELLDDSYVTAVTAHREAEIRGESFSSRRVSRTRRKAS